MIRALQASLIALLVASAVLVWRDAPRPTPPGLEALARAELEAIFGEDVQYASMQIDLARGVSLDSLRVPSPGLRRMGPDGRARPVDGFTARRVEIDHDVAALAAGMYEPKAIRILGASLFLHETAEGVAPDFRFDLPESEGDGPLPSLSIDDATIWFRARAASERLRPGVVLVARVEQLALEPGAHEGGMAIAGRLGTVGLGQDDEPIHVEGRIEPDLEAFRLRASCEHLALTPELLDTLHPDVAAPLTQKSIQSGAIALVLEQAAGQSTRLSIQWDADVEVQVEDIPGIETIEATTQDQLQELFGRGVLQLTVDQERVAIQELVTQMAGGQVRATGWVKHESGELEIEFRIEDLDLEDPAVRRALGAEGAEILDQFAPSGIVDAFGVVRRDAEGETSWNVDVLLEAASFEFLGAMTPEGHREGFPYRISEATGRVRIGPDGVFFDDIVGFHRSAEITVRGHKRTAWAGGPTGRILFDEKGPDIRLTIEVAGLVVDDDLRAAIEGSEFAGLLDEFQLAGVIDLVEVDVVSIPGVDDAAQTEVRLQLEGEQFRYAPFPLPIEDVRGTITLTRPIEDGKRGRVYAFAVDGWSDGAPIHVEAEIQDHLRRGLLVVRAEDIPLGGAVTETILAAEATKGGLASAWRYLDPRGRADVRVEIPLQDEPQPLRLVADLLGASARIDAEGSPAPLTLDMLSGQIAVEGVRIELRKLAGRIGVAPVRLHGVMPQGGDGPWDLHLEGEGLRIGKDQLVGLRHLVGTEALLPRGLRLEPGGRLDLVLDLDRATGDAPLEAHIVATNVESDVAVPGAGRARLEGDRIRVSPTRVHLENVRLSRKDLSVTMPRTSFPMGEADEDAVGPGIEGRIVVALDDVVLTPPLLRLLPESTQDVIGEWTKGREVTTTGLVVDAPPDNGPVRLQGALELVVPEGQPVDDGPRGGVAFEPLVVGLDEQGSMFGGRVRFTAFAIDLGVSLEEITGAVEIERLRLGDRPEGVGRLADVAGRVEGIRFSRVVAPIVWSGGILTADPITGRVAGGQLVGNTRIHTGAPSAYEGQARVAGFDVGAVAEDLSPTGPPYSGQGFAEVRFQNRTGALRDLTAAGTVRVRDGELGELPFLANIFALFAEVLTPDDRPQFQRADVDFVLEKEVFRLDRFDLAGELFVMPGRGTLDLSAVVDLVFTPDFIKGMVVPGVTQLPIIGDILRGTLREELLYAVRVRGDLGNPRTSVMFLPPLGIDRSDAFEGIGPGDLPRRRLPGWFR